MKLFAAVMPLFVVGISMVHFHPGTDEWPHNPHGTLPVHAGPADLSHCIRPAVPSCAREHLPTSGCRIAAFVISNLLLLCKVPAVEKRFQCLIRQSCSVCFFIAGT